MTDGSGSGTNPIVDFMLTRYSELTASGLHQPPYEQFTFWTGEIAIALIAAVYLAFVWLFRDELEWLI